MRGGGWGATAEAREAAWSWARHGVMWASSGTTHRIPRRRARPRGRARLRCTALAAPRPRRRRGGEGGGPVLPLLRSSCAAALAHAGTGRRRGRSCARTLRRRLPAGLAGCGWSYVVAAADSFVVVAVGVGGARRRGRWWCGMRPHRSVGVVVRHRRAGAVTLLYLPRARLPPVHLLVLRQVRETASPSKPVPSFLFRAKESC